MKSEFYTPGHSENASAFMARRTLATHGQFFEPHLEEGLRILDCGCGPGSITLEIAESVRPGLVTGIDQSESEIELAIAEAAKRGVEKAKFVHADCDSLPFETASFDRVISHALMEHLAEPLKAISEFWRVLNPGGLAGLCSPDWGGFILAPPSEKLSAAVCAYRGLQQENGGDVQAGRKLGGWLRECGFIEIEMSARYECYESLPVIGEYLALQLEREDLHGPAETFRQWSRSKEGMFAQTWISAIGEKPR